MSELLEFWPPSFACDAAGVSHRPLACNKACATQRIHRRSRRSFIVILWRARLASAKRSLTEDDLDPRRGALLVRRGKGGRRREVG